MIKSKRKVDRFINHLFTLYHVPRIPVYIHWHHPSLVSREGEFGFGVFSIYDPEHPCIHIAAKVLGKSGIMEVFAHEFGHYLQFLFGQEFEEDVAEKYSSVIMSSCNFYRRHFVVAPKHGKGFVKPRKMRMPFPIYIDENGKRSVTPPKIEKEAP